MRDPLLAGPSHCLYFKPGARGQERKALEEPPVQFEVTINGEFQSKMPHIHHDE